MTVKQAAQVLDLLAYFAHQCQPATLTEISEHFGWPRSSTFNLLNTLAERGFIYEPRARAGYYPTPVIEELATRIMSWQPIPAASTALLGELAKVSGETAVLAARSGLSAVFLDAVESEHALRYTAPKGKRVPLVGSTTGRALLAQRPAAERGMLMQKAEYKAYTPTSLMSPEAVEAEIQRSMARGWFEGHQEYSQGMTAIAFPVSIAGRSYAVLVAGPQSRIEPSLAALAAQAAAIVERHLGAGSIVKTLA